MTLEEFEKEVKEWYIKNNVNLSETWFEVRTIGLWKKKKVILLNKVSIISFQGLFNQIESFEEETYSECFVDILTALYYFDINKKMEDNTECVETFCTVKIC